MKRKTRDCVRTAPIDVLVPRAMWNSAKVLDISCFWLRKRSGTIGTTGTLERLEPELVRNILNGAKRWNDWNDWNGLIPVMNGA
jgi:hypothetical protein